MRTFIGLGLVFVMLAGVAIAQTFGAKDLKECEEVQGDPDRTIQACSRVIHAFEVKNTNSSLGTAVLGSAFFHRSKAYGTKQDFQRQIQDLNQVLVLKP